MNPSARRLFPLVVLLCLSAANAAAQPAPSSPDLFRELRWRGIGPIRGGRTKAATGVAGRPGVFFIGAVNGGVWRTNDYGRTWVPLFDDQPTGSIGALAVAPSSPDVLYVGSGEGLQRPDLSVGDGIYKSIDGGRTFRHLGLRDGQQIPQIAVDPKDPERLFVAVLGHPYGPNEERGIFRSLDGGQTFEKVLYTDADTGGVDVVLDPSDPRIVFAALWEARQAPWENGQFRGPGSGLYKSIDGGTSWRRIGKGLPTFEGEGLGRIGLGIAPSRPSRLFATVEAKKNGGLYRSDDSGESWVRITDDTRVAERADDFAEVKVHPRNPDVVFTASVVVWKSVDGGKTFAALRGAPGGDDYQRIWIDPGAPDTMLLASDQGAVISVNGGETWSSWYNQSTAQMFHATADNAFPYRVCGGQQESGSACVPSSGPGGAITFRDWQPAGVDEYGYAAPDPLDPDIVYGGRVSRWDRRTGQLQDVSPEPLRGPDYRVLRTQPLVFSPLDPHTLYFASNTLWKTTSGGRSWTKISPDLTRTTWEPPASVGKYRGTEPAAPERRGVIYAVAPSPLERGTIWAGTDDGLVHLTRDGGKTWREVTPPQLSPWTKVSVIEASHKDPLTAYAAINTLRLDDLRPHVLRTRDGGKSWTEIVRGLPPDAPVNVVREDPMRRGLLFAGTERSVFVSFDDGELWEPLRLNLPASSVRDLVVKEGDLVAATHGRGFWILDDIAPLRQAFADVLGSPVHLFAPRRATRVRWNTNTDTPLPPDEPTGLNPPDGATIDYWLKAPAAGPVLLEILDAKGQLVRRYSSADRREPPRDDGNVPRYWIRPAQVPSAEAGLHRLVWDLHYPPPAAQEPGYPISATPLNTPKEPRGPWALPGRYTVRLRAGGETRTQPLDVRLDPRLKTPPEALREQLALSLRLSGAMGEVSAALDALRARREAGLPVVLDRQLAELERSAAEGRRRRGAKAAPPALSEVAAELSELFQLVQAADAAPTPQAAQAATRLLETAAALRTRLSRLTTPPAATH
ncbi:MAG TPA: hypothetical protein VN883_11255 [Myxococcales bacterium]|jgi:photosystem II stability/assembly factor-like uncharacterized protein|nr:hypothetical protein [Myxococcales bacterium]